jgi:glycopeptide antibiotics resistance protein
MYLDLDGIFNLIIILICLTLLLKLSHFKNILDWVVGILFVVYFYTLYDKTIYFVGSMFIQRYFMISLGNLHGVSYTLNLIPFKSIIYDIRYLSSNLYQFFGNILMLTPLTFSMLYFRWVKTYKQAFYFSLLCSVGIEIIQFLYNVYFRLFSIGMNRSTDVDDVILNTIGAIIGIGCYKLWLKIRLMTREKKRLVKKEI